jgi:3-hydroxyisobutyrate dehydrogenase-like beta-hydroxyacid dehydrogenase
VDEHTYGFVGLGAMGMRIAQTMVRSGLDVVGFDVRPEPLVALAAAGGRTAASLEEVAAATGTVSVCVLSETQVLDVCDRLSQSLAAGSLVLVHATVRPSTVIRAAEIAAARGVRVVDAPISGNMAGAETGTLSVMVGAARDDVTQAVPAFEAMGSNVFYLGTLGAGEAAKLANNAMSIVNTLAVQEALRLGRAYGLSEEDLVDVCSVSTGASIALTARAKIEWMLRNHTLAGTPELYHFMSKDLEMAVGAAEEAEVPMTFTDVAASMVPELTARYMVELGIEPAPFA